MTIYTHVYEYQGICNPVSMHRLLLILLFQAVHAKEVSIPIISERSFESRGYLILNQ